MYWHYTLRLGSITKETIVVQLSLAWIRLGLEGISLDVWLFPFFKHSFFQINLSYGC